ncbi:MAG: hypothetical protein ACYS9T_02505 [Planctomycetota bacterium]|jgi:hypothetical protein
MEKKTKKSTVMAINKKEVTILGFVLALSGLISCGLAAVPAIILCILGLRSKAHRKLAWLYLLLSALSFFG